MNWWFRKVLVGVAIAVPLAFAPPGVSASSTPTSVDAVSPRPLIQHFTAAPGESVPKLNRDDGPYSVVVFRQFSWPSPGPITSPFGPRTCAKDEPCTTFHEGDDLAPGAGTPVKAVTAGTVASVGYDGNYGLLVTIDQKVDHQQVIIYFAHLAPGSVTVRAGEHVNRAQTVARIGETGRAYGAHLHFEIHVNGIPVDPVTWMAAHKAMPYPTR